MTQVPPQLTNAAPRRVNAAMQQLQRLATTHPRECQYQLLVLDEHGRTALTSFTSQDAWQAAITDLVARDVNVFPFIGVAVPISERPDPPLPPLRYLLVPDNPVPLFALPTAHKPDGTGQMGQKYTSLTMVNTLQGDVVAQAAESDGSQPGGDVPPVDDGAEPSVL